MVATHLRVVQEVAVILPKGDYGLAFPDMRTAIPMRTAPPMRTAYYPCWCSGLLGRVGGGEGATFRDDLLLPLIHIPGSIAS